MAGRAGSEADGDILIVLSSGDQPDGIIGLVSYGRAIYAVRAWREGHFRAVVVTFEAVGLTVAPRPFPEVPRPNNPINHFSEAWSLGLETIKIAYYWQRGWISSVLTQAWK